MSTTTVPLIFGIFLALLTAILLWVVVNKQFVQGNPRIVRRYRVIVTWPLLLYLVGNGVLHESLGLSTGFMWDYSGVVLYFVTLMMLEAIG